MTTLNGLPRSWDSFIQGIHARRKLISLSRLREECAQEKARLVKREENMGATDGQVLVLYTKKNFNKKEKNQNHSQQKGQETK